MARKDPKHSQEFDDASVLGGRAVVSGVSISRVPTSPWVKQIARMADLGLVVALFLLCARLARLDPYPDFRVLAVGVFAALVPLLARLRTRATPGEWLTRTQAEAPAGLKSVWPLPRLTTRGDLEGFTLALTAAASLLALTSSGWWLGRWILGHPLYALAEKRSWPAQPPALNSDDHWTRAFYYSLGSWPSRPFGTKVVHALPYEYGPPAQFPGKILARWDPPEIAVTFEGPKTPESMRNEYGRLPSRDNVRACFTEFAGSYSCLEIRRALLSRHLQEISQTLGNPSYQLAWIQVANEQLPVTDRPQGLWITARQGDRVHERFVAVTWLGTHQAFHLDHRGGEKGATARRLFEQSIRSLKITDHLDALRAWSERDLLEIRMKELQDLPWESPSFFEKGTDIQSALLSRISVDPKDYNAYFHLGGTSSLLIRHALKIGAPELAAAAQKSLQSAWLYAKDVKPQEPRNIQLERLWDELKKSAR
jgi:hypothetical protein